MMCGLCEDEDSLDLEREPVIEVTSMSTSVYECRQVSLLVNVSSLKSCGKLSYNAEAVDRTTRLTTLMLPTRLDRKTFSVDSNLCLQLVVLELKSQALQRSRNDPFDGDSYA
jgi:hypothetical protein